MNKGYIYGLKCPFENKCRYVGQTVQPLSKRLYKHLYEIDKHNTYKNAWLKKLRRLNLLIDIEIFIIEQCDINKINEREIFWIKEYKAMGYSLTNTTEGGDCGSLGYKHSNEAKTKISEAGKRQKGKKRTNDTKNKISESLKGKIGRNTGNKHSDETKKQISESKQGTISWNAKAILQLDKDDNMIKEWQSAKYAAQQLKLSQGNIWSVINGNRNKCGGYKWKLK